VAFDLCLILLRLALFEGPYRAREPMPEPGILDVHIHTAGLGVGSDCFISKRLKESFKFGIYMSSYSTSEEEIREKGDQIVIKHLSENLARSKFVSHAIVLALDGIIDQEGKLDREKTEFYVSNDFVFEQTALYENLYFGASINPYRPDAIERLRQVASQGAKLIKWIPSIQLIDPSDPKLTPFYKELSRLGLPLLSHSGNERSFTIHEDRFADPVRLKLPLSLGVQVIAAHVATTGENGNQDNVDRLLPMFKQYPNLFSDISSLTQFNKKKYLHKILNDDAIRNRLIYGSDMPLIATPMVSAYLYPLQLSLGEMTRIQGIENVWDRDVTLKQQLGFPKEIFQRTRELFFGIKGESRKGG